MALELRSQSMRNVFASKPLPSPPSKPIPPNNRPLPPKRSRPKVGFVSSTPKLVSSHSRPTPRTNGMKKPPPAYSLPPAITKSNSLHGDAHAVTSPPPQPSMPSAATMQRLSKSSIQLFGHKPTSTLDKTHKGRPQLHTHHSHKSQSAKTQSRPATATHAARSRNVVSPQFSQSRPTSPTKYVLPSSPPAFSPKHFTFPDTEKPAPPRTVHFQNETQSPPSTEALAPRHRTSQSFHYKKSEPSQTTRNPVKRPMTPHRHKLRQQQDQQQRAQHPKPRAPKIKKRSSKKIYDDAHYDEADLNSDDEKEHQIDWKRGEMIGIGAFGKVYKAHDKKTGKLIAIKQIPFDPATMIKADEEHNHLSASDTKKTRLKQVNREADVMRQLQHANIVQFYGFQQSRKYRTLCILMEFVDGSSIDSLYSQQGRFPEHKVKTYTQQIMSALDFAHSKKVIHRDIKGKNILVSKSGVIKLADFGSAKLADATMGRSTKFTASMNYNYTPLWTAPEVLHGKYDAKIDIWSVGCVMIEMATAKPPWSECNFENPFAALYHIGQPDKLPKYDHHFLSSLCQDFIRLCLTRDPAKRCSASELLRHEFLDSSK